jgi:hypothetical protein
MPHLTTIAPTSAAPVATRLVNEVMNSSWEVITLSATMSAAVSVLPLVLVAFFLHPSFRSALSFHFNNLF